MIDTTVQYLARSELYRTEKPYAADFEIEESDGARKTNYILHTQEVTVTPIAQSEDFCLDTHGFCIVRAKTSLCAQDALERPNEVEDAYLDELAAILHKRFPQYSRIEGLEFVVRKRDARFPSNEVAVVQYEQPASLAHSDFSPRGAFLQLQSSFPGQEEYLSDREYDMINVWRPLAGPNNDWPLALCDFTSVDPENDISHADILHRDRVVENQVLFPNEKHRWYYVKDQQPEDLIVFRNADSTGRRSMAFHCAFFNPHSQSPLRSSCEVRFAAFR